MIRSLLPTPRPAPAVLFIGHFSVEWFEPTRDGSVRMARIDVTEPKPELLVRAAEEARRAAGCESRACVLAIAHPLSFHKLLALPPLSRKELASVFRRRARGLAGDNVEHVYFSAREMGREVGEPGKAESVQWLLAGVRVGARDLRLLLRDRGFRVQRVVSAELAALEWGRQHVRDPGQASIAIVVGESSVAVALVHGSSLLYQASIEGDLSSNPALATGLIHEIKTCSAYWKKQSRGQTVAEVVVVGLARARVDLLALTLSSILPGSTVQAVADEACDKSGRFSLLEAPLASGPLSPELSFWLPQRGRLVGMLGALGGIAALAATTIVFEATADRADAIRARALALRRATADLEELNARNDEDRERIAKLERYVRRGVAVREHGLPLERILAAVLGAFSGRARFEELSLHSVEAQPARVTIQGRCDLDPARMVADLRALLSALERSAAFSELTLSLPESFEDQSTRGAAFTIEARVES